MSRIEHDLIGDLELADTAYWGVHTQRAVENFPISGRTIGACSELVDALVAVKEACALANAELGLLAPELADAIVKSAQKIRAGALHDHFVVDLIQGGAGTSSNMNANEVVANLALEIMGKAKGDYGVLHPNEHVNLGQSTNDVYPTALKIALIFALRRLDVTMAELEAALTERSQAFAGIIKMGRTQLQDAVPMTLGQEFATFAQMIKDERRSIKAVEAELCILNLGGTAIGTGITADPRLGELSTRHLSQITGLELSLAQDRIAATQDTGALVAVSSALKRLAIKLSKIANDLRLLSSGPRAGLGDIELPARQAGSSIMPGKVNPVIPEVVNQVCFEVIGADLTVTMAAEGGQMQLNAFEPVIFASIERSIRHLESAMQTLSRNCISGITADAAKLRATVEHSIGIVTALTPYIGYVRATEVALEAHRTDDGVANIVLREKLMDQSKLDAALAASAMVGS
ncbi:aspartate ammonia-lyase [Paracoccus sp. (in: a-proteobacteria)]|uniref:aspartate ammonia-lyase n=1 Tax=Paracoccus sp. TaxID=267 RepID=UPI00289E7DA6|nr:aspartate ammonia-lyase [Paracoccus sp. (in: a-proteobacteria)]